MLKKNPSQTELNTLVQVVNNGDYAAAETIATPLSKAYPKATLIWKILGVAIAEQGRMEEAIAPMQKVIQLEPKDAEAHRNLAMALKELGKTPSAEQHFRKCIALNYQDAIAYSALGRMMNEQKNYSEAEKLCRKAITIKYDLPEAHDQLGVSLLWQKKISEAESCFRSAILLDPTMADAHNNLGITLNELRQYEAATLSYCEAIKLNPRFANAYCNLATNFSCADQLLEAEAAYRKAIEIDPQHNLGLSNLGALLNNQGKLQEAKALLERALDVDPHWPPTLNNLGNVHKELGTIEIAMEYYRKAFTNDTTMASAFSNLLLAACYHSTLSPDQALQEAINYGKHISALAKHKYQTWYCQTTNVANDKIRIGFVSGDLRRHAVTFFLEGLLRYIDKNKFELIAYPTQPKEDEVTALIKPHFIKWQALYGKSDRDAAELIYRDAPHILFDLSGHTAYNRLPMFAYKPAPIQVSWAGYPATTGLAEMDYILADPYLVPVGQESPFVEQVWRLPEIAGCFAPLMDDIDIAELPALQNGFITFGCFNNLTKMNDDVVELWAQVLHAVPNSKLHIQTRQLSDESVLKNTYTRYAAHGITPERLILEGKTARLDYFKSYNKIDIALDPFPSSGGTTTADTLFMSVPIITLKGTDFRSRLGESIAQNVGQSEWIAADKADYIQKAKIFSSDLTKLAKIRSELRARVMASPLFDTTRFARHFEQAMMEMINIAKSR